EDVVGRAAAQGDAGEVRVHVGHALRVGDQVVVVAGMVRALAGAAVRLRGGVEVAAGAAGIDRAAVALLVDVEAVAAAALQAADVAGDVHAVAHRHDRKPAADQAARGRRQVGGGAGDRAGR